MGAEGGAAGGGLGQVWGVREGGGSGVGERWGLGGAGVYEEYWGQGVPIWGGLFGGPYLGWAVGVTVCGAVGGGARGVPI